MKKIKEHFTDLPDDIEAMALANTPAEALDFPMQNLRMAIYHAFVWSSSPQGLYFWVNIADNCAYVIKERDMRTLDRMTRHGGSFLRSIAEAARVADSINYAALKDAFPGYWMRYGDDGIFARRES